MAQHHCCVVTSYVAFGDMKIHIQRTRLLLTHSPDNYRACSTQMAEFTQTEQKNPA
jgi:hypothetical protein